MTLDYDELRSITGGSATKWGFAIIIGGVVSFLVGVLDGFLRPLSCNK